MNHTHLFLPAIAGPHLPTPEGWKAELAWITKLHQNVPHPKPSVGKQPAAKLPRWIIILAAPW